jgi:hypothetical protein
VGRNPVPNEALAHRRRPAMTRFHGALHPSRSGAAGDGGARDGAAAGGIPLWVGVLLRLTTARLDRDPLIDRRILRRLLRLEAEGWLVRTAGPRNYTAWRHSEALAKAVAVIVLPNADFPFTQDERNVVVLRDLVIAELNMRHGGAVASDERVREVLVAIAGVLYPDHAMDDQRLERLLRQIERKTRSGLAGRSF